MATTKSKSLFGLLKNGSTGGKSKKEDSVTTLPKAASVPSSTSTSPSLPSVSRSAPQVELSADEAAATAATSILWLKLDEAANGTAPKKPPPAPRSPPLPDEEQTTSEDRKETASPTLEEQVEEQNLLDDDELLDDETPRSDVLPEGSSSEEVNATTSGDEKSDILSSDSTMSAADDKEEARNAFRSANSSFTGSLKSGSTITGKRLVRGASSNLPNHLGIRRSRSFQGIGDEDGTVEATEFTEFTEFTEDGDDSPRGDHSQTTIEDMGDDPGGLLSLSKFLGNSAAVADGEEEEILDDSEDNILYIVGFGTLLIKGGTLSKLVEKLCDHLHKDENYENDFLMTLTYFTTPTELLNELKIRFDTKPEVDPLWRAKALLSNRTKIYNLIKKWIVIRYDDFLDENFKNAVLDFAETKMKPLDFDIQAIKTLLTEQSNLYVERKTKAIKEKEKISSSGPTTLEEVLDTNPKSLAEQLTAYEVEMFKEIEQREYMKQAWNKKDNTINAPKILQFIRHFNKVSMWTSAAIVSQRQFKKRVERLENIMKLLAELIAIRNFNGAHQIMAGKPFAHML
eukprot:TRINITY_DN157_c0_g1_i2.p1 TRINITY_DN157_c0_g1~~TRINITY_DN157_c0_g1_i2.p1  ORF type:complete len:570 (-),score=151.64 TRINITY_DN157_c0_g1_i2:2335-4044(-)